jgi:putative ABC transport system ATP-binding protein
MNAAVRMAPEHAPQALRTTAVISARALGFSYDRRVVLRDLNLQLQSGEIVVITGASGAGKTTLLTLCGALSSVQDGELEVLGRNMKGLNAKEQREVRSSIGFIFQSHHLLEALTAGQNVVMSMCGRARVAEASRRAEGALAALGLSHRIDAFPEHMSGGEQQRVAVARALVRDPKLILADEPTASLDDVSAAIVKDAIRDAARRLSCAVLLVTHDARLFDIADRRLRLVDGTLR